MTEKLDTLKETLVSDQKQEISFSLAQIKAQREDLLVSIESYEKSNKEIDAVFATNTVNLHRLAGALAYVDSLIASGEQAVKDEAFLNEEAEAIIEETIPS
jgi:hypothetical protein